MHWLYLPYTRKKKPFPSIQNNLYLVSDHHRIPPSPTTSHIASNTMLPTESSFYTNNGLTSVIASSDRPCSICLDSDIIDPVTLPCPCKNIYCRESITQWLNSSARCPTCKKLFFIPPHPPEDMREYLEIYGFEAFGEELVQVASDPPGHHEFTQFEYLLPRLVGMQEVIDNDDVLYEDRRWASFDFPTLRLILIGRANELAYFQVLDGRPILDEELELGLDGCNMPSQDVVDRITVALLDELEEQHVEALQANGDDLAVHFGGSFDHWTQEVQLTSDEMRAEGMDWLLFGVVLVLTHVPSSQLAWERPSERVEAWLPVLSAAIALKQTLDSVSFPRHFPFWLAHQLRLGYTNMPLPTEEEFRAKNDLKEIKTAHEEDSSAIYRSPWCRRESEWPVLRLRISVPVGMLRCLTHHLADHNHRPRQVSDATQPPSGSYGNLTRTSGCDKEGGRSPPTTSLNLPTSCLPTLRWPATRPPSRLAASVAASCSELMMSRYTRLDEGLLEIEDRATFRVDLISDILTYCLNYQIDFAVVEGIVLPDSTVEDWKLVVSTLIQFCQLLEGETLPVREVTSKLLEALRMSSWNAGPALKAFLAKSDEQIIREHDDAQYCEELYRPSDAKIAHFPFAVTGLAWRVTLWENSKKRIATGRSPESAATEEQGEQAPGGN
ncbi:uncharacterized protein MYCFIDRAFT_177032 [Pseudocercospora fijiensis CIRAD86]|uniref:RING-type domain-containing protein n=1 Tax=Pseudocercospora fijiensis (strain CIRAD86) TaxID=383855 RepID=M3A600_PSEFD|nr:uncharacterized protein MYCFIDRAFT_177032 [Pseudocercospora fijiensis CIRAD86]EME80046.1 hypothetical protein MYCFIDRAFT_177032 [Pseudocercospora fijiensis CIRAD86]